MTEDAFNKQQKLLSRFYTIRKQTEAICAPLSPEDYIPQPEVFVSPPKWHIAHTTWFFEEFVLSRNLKNYKRYNSEYAYLFNSYYNGIGERLHRFSRGVLTRPGIDQIWQYRKSVDEAMKSLLETPLPILVLQLIELGLQHEQQHQELLITDLKYIFSLNPLFPVYKPNFSLVTHRESPANTIVLDEGIYQIGFAGEGFCFDNELGKHRVFIEPVAIDGNLVTNGDVLEFIQAGGYQNHNYWLDEGWAHIQTQNITNPLYWKEIEGKWFQYTLGGLQALENLDVACHLSYYEANAIAMWKNKRLCTEFEWEAAAKQLTWGNAWEWTQSAYLPYPNYKKPEGAVGEYNGKFMVNQMVLRGASKATSKNHSRTSYRNFFHPHYSWQITGVRLAQNI